MAHAAPAGLLKGGREPGGPGARAGCGTGDSEHNGDTVPQP